MIRLGKLEGILLLFFLLFFCFSLLYIFRSFDNNTLASWKWVFGDKGFSSVLPFLLLGLIFSLFISQHITLEKYQAPLLAIIAGTSVLPLWSEPELLLDSGRYFLQAKNLSENGVLFFFKEWGESITAWTDMPLAPFLYGLVLKYGNESRISIQLFNTIIFILTVIITYKTGARLWNRELGFYAGLLLVGMPYLLTQVPQMLVDVHAMFFHILAVYCFIEAMKSTDNFSLFLSSVSLVLALFVKYSIWPLIALLPMTGFFVYLQSNDKNILKRMFFVLIPAGLISIVLISFKLDVFSEQLKMLYSYQRPALKIWGEGIISSLLFQCHPFIIIFALFSGVRAYQLKDKHFLIVFMYCLLIVIMQIQRIRYMIPLLPFIALMAAYGIVAFKETALRRLTAYMIVSSSLAILYVCYLPFFQTTSMMNIKMAGEALNELEVEAVNVTVLPQESSEGSTYVAIPLLDLFTNKQINSRQRWPHDKPDHLSAHTPLLFTWMLNKPSYYELNTRQSQSLPSLVVVSSKVLSLDDYKHLDSAASLTNIKYFTRQSGVFRYRTFFSVLN